MSTRSFANDDETSARVHFVGVPRACARLDTYRTGHYTHARRHHSPLNICTTEYTNIYREFVQLVVSVVPVDASYNIYIYSRRTGRGRVPWNGRGRRSHRTERQRFCRIREIPRGTYDDDWGRAENSDPEI